MRGPAWLGSAQGSGSPVDGQTPLARLGREGQGA